MANTHNTPDQEKIGPAKYFKDLLDQANKGDEKANKVLGIFRVLCDMYQTDEVLSEFTRYNDPSIYGLAEIWSSSSFKPLFINAAVNIQRSFRKPMEIGNRTIYTHSRNDGNSKEFMQAIIKILETPQSKLRNKVVYEQTIRLQMCPTCYGGMEGFRTQRLLQETLKPDAENETFDPKRVEFAANDTVT